MQGYLHYAIAPRPICFASTIDKNGEVNLSPFSFFNVFSINPPICVFDAPHKKYSGLYLSLTSSEGASKLHITLTYNDGREIKDFILPDYYNDILEGDANLSYLLHDLAKWGPDNKMAESDHHNIDVLNIHPDARRVLKKVTVSKDKAGYLVFWAATGVAE